MEHPQSGINLMKPQHSVSREGETKSTETKTEKSSLVAKMLDKIMSLSIFMLFLGVPLFFTGLTFQGIAFEKQLYFYFWLLLALVVWAAKAVVTGEMKIRRTPLDIPILAFWLVYLVATIFSINRWTSFWGFFGDPSRGLMSVTALVIVYYILLSNFNKNILKWSVTAIVLSGALVSIWTTLGVLGIKFLPAKLMALSPLSLVGSVSGLGIFLGALLPILITVIFKIRTGADSTKGISKNILTGILLVVAVLDIFLLLTLYAFVPWIGVLVGMGFFLIFILAQIIRPAQNWTWLPMVAFVAVLIVLMIGVVKIARVNLPTEVSPTYKLSFDLAKESLKDKAILGSGPATYGYDFSLYRPKEFNLNNFYNLRFYQGTGMVMEALPTIGILGTVFLVLLILSFISVAVYLLARQKDKDKTYSLGFITASLIFIYAGVTSRVEGAILIFSVLILTLALAMLLKESDSEEKYVNLSLKASPKFALALAFVFMVISAGVAYLFVFLGKIYVADLYAGSAARQTEVTEKGSITKFAQAASLNPRESRYFTRIGQEFMVLANSETLKDQKDMDIDAVKRYLNNSIAATVQGKNLTPKDVLAVESLAQIYENAGLYIPDSLNLAQTAYADAQKLEPHNPNYYVKLGQIKTTQAASEKDEAKRKQLVQDGKDFFQKAIDEKVNFAPGYYFLSLADEALGDIDGAVDSAQKAFAYERSSINYAFNLGRLFQVRGKGDDNQNAEILFKQILGVNDKEINTHFTLGLLYEKTNKKKEAVDEYKKVIELLPEAQADVKTQIEKMISNIQNGIENTPENLKVQTEQ
jgi:putative inorganic carbon (hco3(-)) transporter